MGRKPGLIFLLLLAVFGAGMYLTYSLMRNRAPESVVTRQLTPTSNATPFAFKYDEKAIRDPGAIADAAARVEPSVVTIDVEQRPRYRYGNEDIYGERERMQEVPRGTGSGVIISPDGIIVTNNHVVQNATHINVTFQDGHEVAGRVVGADPQSDLAVVKVEEKDLPAATIADSDKVRVGEWVVAVGDPLRVGTTVTAGIISAIRKNQGTGQGTAYASLLQTDAAINPGNSGGALADIEGRLIGINSAIASTNGGNIGIGFAIPANTMRDITTQLIQQGHVTRPWLGIASAPLTDRFRAQLNLGNVRSGLIIGEVRPSSPAATAGLQPGDVITSINGTGLKAPEDLQGLIQSAKVGDVLRLTVWRQGTEQTKTATLTERPASPLSPAGFTPPGG